MTYSTATPVSVIPAADVELAFQPSGRPQVLPDIVSEVVGRPHDPTVRVHAYAAMLSRHGYRAGAPTFHAIAFWDAGLSTFLGCSPRGQGFRRTPQGPVSPEVDASLDQLASMGAIGSDPDLDPALLQPLSTNGTAAPRLSDSGSPWASSWWHLMEGLIEGWRAPGGDGPSVSPFRCDLDVALLLDADPTYGSAFWEPYGTPAHADARGPLLELAGTISRDRAARFHSPLDSVRLGWYLSRHLCRLAATASPAFGSRDHATRVRAHRAMDIT